MSQTAPTKQINVTVPADLRERAKLIAVRHDISLRALVELALKRQLDSMSYTEIDAILVDANTKV
jgi:predicted HicB family RNase H-like nuclease